MPLTPAVLEAANAFRRRLLLRERQSATAMVRYYGESWRRIKVEADALIAEVEAMRAAGETITRGKLIRLERLRAIERQTLAEMERFAGYADIQLTAAQREALLAGERDAYELVQLSFPQAEVSVTFYRMPREAAENYVGMLQDGTPLGDKLREYVGDAASKLSETLVSGLVQGKNPREVARLARQQFGMGLTDSLRLARTEQLRAYRTATLQSYQANGNIVKGWRRLATKDDRVCAACIILDGTEYTTQDAMDDHPNGRCLASGERVLTAIGWKRIESIRVGDIVMTHTGQYQAVTGTSRRWYDGEILRLRQGRDSVRLTPEHQVLTPGGWVRASSLSADSILLILNDVVQRDSNLSTVQPRASRMASFLASASAFLPDLCHSGSSSTANLDDMKAKSMLYRATGYSHTGESPASWSASRNARSWSVCRLSQFSCRDWARLRAACGVCAAATRLSMISGLSRIRRFAASLGEIGSTSHFFISRISDLVLMPASAVNSRYVASSEYLRRSHSQTGSPNRSAKSRSQRSVPVRPASCGVLRRPSARARWYTARMVRLGSSSEISSVVNLDHISRTTESSASVHRGPICRLLDRVGSIIHRLRKKAIQYTGWVYDLEVANDHSFIAGGIVVHNCAMVPITKTFAELGIDAPEPQFTPESGRDWFLRQDEATQRKILGSGTYDAWKDGLFALEDLPHKTRDATWGDSWTPRPLYDLLGESAPVGGYAGWLAGRGGEEMISFGSIQDAESWLVANIKGLQSASLGEFDPRLAEDVARELSSIQKTHGEIPGISSIEAVRSDRYIARYRGGHVLELNPDITEEWLNRRHASGLTPARPGWAGVIDHEMGHAFTPPIFDVGLPGTPMTDFGVRLDAFFLDNRERIANELSRYAASARHEFVAEAFAARESGSAAQWILDWLKAEGL